MIKQWATKTPIQKMIEPRIILASIGNDWSRSRQMIENENFPTAVSNNLVEPPKCEICGHPMQFMIDMSRVEAGVGGPRPTYVCPLWENHV